MPGNPNEIKLVNNAMANATRRKIMNFLADGDKNTEEIWEEVGKATLDFHLKVLQQASLIELEDNSVKLSEYDKNFLKDKAEKSAEKTADISQAKPVEIAEIRQLLPCIADSSKFRIYACKEDLEARTIKTNENVLVPENFYTVLVEDLMENCERAYTFK